MILPFQNISPTIGKDVFIADNSAVIGDVVIGDHSNVWFNVAIRGDVHEIRIGKRTNIQDGSVIHVTRGVSGTYVGDDVTVGHMALLHACTIGNRCLVGMGSIVLDAAVMEDQSMLAAGSMLTPGKRVPSGELWAGRPAKFMRKLTDEEIDYFGVSAENYVTLAAAYKI